MNSMFLIVFLRFFFISHSFLTNEEKKSDFLLITKKNTIRQIIIKDLLSFTSDHDESYHIGDYLEGDINFDVKHNCLFY